MSEVFTKNMARNIFYGGSVFFFLLLLALTFDTQGVLAERDHRENITPEVVLGKKSGKTTTVLVVIPFRRRRLLCTGAGQCLHPFW